MHTHTTNEIPDLPDFVEIAPGIGYGAPPTSGWIPIADCPLLIVVGVTGVGKSTTIAALNEREIPFTMLPDRRALTDDLIIARLQQADGVPVEREQDRARRFDYTRRFRAQFPGGMAHALAQLQIIESTAAGQLIFDGLRGSNEVEHAAQLLPLARFVALDAPDIVRVQRLLGRNDAFDQIQPGSHPPHAPASRTLPADGANELFSAAEIETLLRLVESGQVTEDDLRAKLQIVCAERRNYDPTETLEMLRNVATLRSLFIDTTRHTPAQAAWDILRFMS